MNGEIFQLNNQLEKVGKSLEEAKYTTLKEKILQQASLISEKTSTGAKGDDTLAPMVFKEGVYGVDNCTKQESVFFLKVQKIFRITYQYSNTVPKN